MFEKFGEFDSYDEINRAAKAQLNEGDLEAIRAIALENGIDRDDVEDYIDGAVGELTTPVMAAVGKIEVEEKEYKISGMLLDFTSELKALCPEDIDLAFAIRKKGKSIAQLIALYADRGLKDAATVDKRIVELTKDCKAIVGQHEFKIGIPDRKARKQIIYKYYLGEEV